MSDYNKATNFATKDTLLTGNPAKAVKGTEIDNEFNAIASAIASKAEPGDITDAVDAAIAALNITGRVVQTVQSVWNSSYSVNGSWVYTGHSATITPTKSTSKILVLVLGGDNWNRNNTDNNNSATIYRNSTDLAAGYSRGLQNQKAMDSGYSHAFDWSNSMCYLDSPATTSSTTYKVYIQGYTTYGGASVMILMEIV